MRSSTTMALRRYPPLARCMYCLAAGAKRSEEHLIPRSLNGRLTLRDAVCEPCRVRTSGPEQATLAREFLVPRTLLALKRPRARKKSPRRLPPVAPIPLDATNDHDIPDTPTPARRGEFPRRFALPAFERAGLLANVERPTDSAAPRAVVCHLKAGPRDPATIAAPAPLADPFAYGYTIAKWAYGLAVAERGLDGWNADAIRRLLLGERRDVFDFVGSVGEPCAATPGLPLHRLGLREDMGRLVVELHLFASAGMTPYEVAVGTLV